MAFFRPLFPYFIDLVRDILSELGPLDAVFTVDVKVLEKLDAPIYHFYFFAFIVLYKLVKHFDEFVQRHALLFHQPDISYLLKTVDFNAAHDFLRQHELSHRLVSIRSGELVIWHL